MEKRFEDLIFSTSESEVVEFKTAQNQYDRNKLGQYFSALSNEANLKGQSSAWIIFGLSDAKEIIGTNISESQLNEYKLEMANHTSPRLSFAEIYKEEYEHKRILIMQIPSAPQGIPVAWKGHYYGRNGESLGALNIEELERIRRQGVLEDWSCKTAEAATIDDLSKKAISQARLLFGIKNQSLKSEIELWDDEKFLNKIKLTIRGRITNAAIILLGKPEAEYLLSPAIAKITWVLRDKDNIEKDYEHFSCPFLLNIENVYRKIRNLKYRYMQEGTLFPEEVDQYDPYIIREALNNCIAHQDYTRGGKINIVEKEDGTLTFLNMGKFIPGSIEEVIMSDAPESQYRNAFLANAMVNLNMIDTIGSGIKRMYMIQRKKFFPLPEYTISKDAVKVVINGKILDPSYASKLAHMPELSLHEIILLDKVQKHKDLSAQEIRELKSKGLLEGKYRKFHISSHVAGKTGQKSEYMRLKGIDDEYIKKMIIDYLIKFVSGRKVDFENILIDKLPDVLDIAQKKDKIKNILQRLRREGHIDINGKEWRMSK